MVAVLGGLEGYDVDCTAHSVGSVKYGGCASGNLNPLGAGGHIFVSYRMAVDGLELRMAVNEDYDAAGPGGESAEGDGSGGSSGDAVAGHSAGGDEQAGNLLHYGRHQGALIAVGDGCAAYYGYGSRERVPEYGEACAGYNGSRKGVRPFLGVVVSI